MKIWLTSFWNEHGERLVFAGLAVLFAFGFYFVGMEEEANVIFIGLAMMFFNKARTGFVGKNSNEIEKPPT